MDECSQTSTCPTSSRCVNSPGSYSCECDAGTTMANGECVGKNHYHFFFTLGSNYKISAVLVYYLITKTALP